MLINTNGQTVDQQFSDNVTPKVTLYTKERKVPEELLSAFHSLCNPETEMNENAEFTSSRFCRNTEYYSRKQQETTPQEETKKERLQSLYYWKKKCEAASSSLTVSHFVEFLKNILPTYSGQFVLAYTSFNKEHPGLEEINEEYREVSGGHAAVRFIAPAEEMAAAFPDIEKAFVQSKKIFFTVLGYFHKRKIIEVRYEFDEEFGPDFKSYITSFKKAHPNVRFLGITNYIRRWADRTLYVSGSGSTKVIEKQIKFRDGWEFYDIISYRNDFWGSSEIYETDIYINQNSEETVLVYNNDFNWSSTLDLKSLDAEITRIGSCAFQKNNHIKNVILAPSVAKIGSRAFASCTNLAHVYFCSNPTIDSGAFEDCKKLTIHAPAGSTAETYAKENNIPFVAE